MLGGMVELIVWHEPAWIGHEDAVRKSQYEAHPGVADFAAEVAEQAPQVKQKGDRKSQVRLLIDDDAARKVVPRMRYLAAKHRLACLDVRQRAVLNPPLLRKVDTLELTSDAGFPIDDPTEAHIADTARQLSDDNWFMALEGDDDTFLQCGFGTRAGAAAGGYMLEVRDGKLMQVEVAEVATVITVFTRHLAGDDSWRNDFGWRSVNLS